MEDLRWYHWLVGIAMGLLGTVFGAGMASQRFINRLLALEKWRSNMTKADGTEKFISIEDFRREQSVCQRHLASILEDIKCQLNRLLEIHMKE